MTPAIEQHIVTEITDPSANIPSEGMRERVPFESPTDYEFKFIDLFAGIGGFRVAMQNLKGKCVFTSEIDLNAQRSYQANFGDLPHGDITKIDERAIPDHDVLCAGFPCQAFSVAGRKGGFNDTRGTLFFDVARIIKEKQPKAFFLENVKGLVGHDKGKTLAVILGVLRDDLGYFVPNPKIINAKDFGVPQNRERIFIVGFRKDLGIESLSVFLLSTRLSDGGFAFPFVRLDFLLLKYMLMLKIMLYLLPFILSVLKQFLQSIELHHYLLFLTPLRYLLILQ